MSSFFVLLGPSGSGKTTITDALKRKYPKTLAHPISDTTREPREGERDGIDYYFIDQETYNKRALEGSYLACSDVYGKSYGTTRASVVEALKTHPRAFVIFNPNGAEQLRAQGFPAVYIGIVPPSLEALEERLLLRGGTNNLGRRLQEAKDDMEYALHYTDYVILNSSVEDAINELETLMCLKEAKCSTR